MTFAFARSFGFLYFVNNALTAFVVVSSFVLAESIVPIRILNGPVSALCKSLYAVILGGFTEFMVSVIPVSIFFISS